ncbi:hypothetical protein RGUI_4200 (plasmid) [Rhodovulum sp. P5]|nr:hypothetical protein RGUI_4200 [Rhodovulum sp. P5]
MIYYRIRGKCISFVTHSKTPSRVPISDGCGCHRPFSC